MHEHYFQQIGIYHLMKNNTSQQAAIVNAQNTSERLHNQYKAEHATAAKAKLLCTPNVYLQKTDARFIFIQRKNQR